MNVFSLIGFEWFAPRKVYLLVAGGLLITSLIAAIFMFGLRDTVSHPYQHHNQTYIKEEIW